MSGFSESMQDASQLLRATVQQKGYHSVTIDGKEAQVTFHSFSQNNTTNCSKRKMWIRAIRCGIGRHWQPGRWTKVNPLHLKPTDFYNYWSGYRTLKENAVLSIFPFKSQSRVADEAQAAQSSHSTCGGWLSLSCRLLSHLPCHSSLSSSKEADHDSCCGQQKLLKWGRRGLTWITVTRDLGVPDATYSSVSALSLQQTGEVTQELNKALQKVKAENEELKCCLDQATNKREKISTAWSNLRSKIPI